MLVYSLLDRKMKEFGQLVVARNEESVKRGIVDGLRGSGSLVERHPDDFDLYVVGEFDQETGVLVPVHSRLIGSVAEILQREVV